MKQSVDRNAILFLFSSVAAVFVAGTLWQDARVQRILLEHVRTLDSVSVQQTARLARLESRVCLLG